MHTGKLNVFQQAMLQWNDLHPYHAVHVMRFQGEANVDRIRETITRRLAVQGLNSLWIDRAKRTFSYGTDPLPIEIEVVPAASDLDQSLNRETGRQLNQGFDFGTTFLPFRFFILAEQDSFLLGTTYFHPIADAESIALLLRELATDYVTGRTPEARKPLDLHPPRHDGLLELCSKAAARKLLALPSDLRTMRRSHRTPLRDANDLGNVVRFMRVDSETLTGLTTTARAWGITLHDLLLAMLMRALSPLAPDRHAEARRCNLSLGTIVNIRRDHGIDSHRTFGLFLGSFMVSHPVPGEITLHQLATDLHRQTRDIKSRKLYLATPLELRLAGRIMSLYPPSRQKRFYHKNHPLWGGITNMNMNKLWPRDHDGPTDYFRAVSTGPITPLVLSVTTFTGHMNIGLTYRPAVFAVEQINDVLSRLDRQFAETREPV